MKNPSGNPLRKDLLYINILQAAALTSGTIIVNTPLQRIFQYAFITATITASMHYGSSTVKKVSVPSSLSSSVPTGISR